VTWWQWALVAWAACAVIVLVWAYGAFRKPMPPSAESEESS
jgi:choline-glycine betaine transporter